MQHKSRTSSRSACSALIVQTIQFRKTKWIYCNVHASHLHSQRDYKGIGMEMIIYSKTIPIERIEAKHLPGAKQSFDCKKIYRIELLNLIARVFREQINFCWRARARTGNGFANGETFRCTFWWAHLLMLFLARGACEYFLIIHELEHIRFPSDWRVSVGDDNEDAFD